jgi:uncharacterized membrane protein
MTARLARIEELLGAAEERGTSAVRRIEHAAAPAWRRATEGEQRWPVSVAIFAAIALQFLLPSPLALMQRGVLPTIELVILVVLVAANPRRVDRSAPSLRMLGLLVIGVASLANAWSVVALVAELIGGADRLSAGALLGRGGDIWLTNVIVFAVWYWELDRGGPAARATGADPHPDFLFAQMASPDMAPADWEPTFADYLYVSFTNATAFSPTDTLPLSRWAKMAMMLQATVSVVTAALVIARAVNILR